MATALPLETQTLYAELLEHLMGVHAQRAMGRLPGSFAEKTIKGHLTTIFYKLGVQDRLALALLAVKIHLAPPEPR